MSSGRLPPAIDLFIGASRSLACLCAAAYAGAVAAVVLSGIVWPIRVVLILVLLGFALWWTAGRALLLAPDSIVRLVWRSDGECEWLERRGQWCHGTIEPGTLVLPVLVVLRLRGAGRRPRTVCVARDGVEREALRRLRVRLGISPPLGPPALTRRLAARLRRRWARTPGRGGFPLGRRREADR